MAQYYCLEAHQSPTEQPKFRYSKSVAMLMLRRGQADRLGPRLIRRRAHCDYVKPDLPKTFLPPHSHLWKWDETTMTFVCKCNKLPPREIEGTIFQLPQSDTWQIQHRTVTFMRFANESQLALQVRL